MPSAHRPGTILPSGEPTLPGGLSIFFGRKVAAYRKKIDLIHAQAETNLTRIEALECH